jgi:uncharacterized membrane protein YvbJ
MPVLQDPDDHDSRDDSLDEWEADDDSIDDDTVACPHCGKAVYLDSVRCPQCAQYINEEESELAAPHKSHLPGWALFTAILLIVVLLFGWALM